VGDISYIFNGGKSRYDAFQMKYEWRMGADVNILSSLTLSKAEGQFGGALENPERQLPGAAGHQQPGRGLRPRLYHQPYNSTTSFVCGAAVRPRQALGQRHADGARRRRRRLADAAASTPSHRARW
jgi:hypothetical protein